MKRSFLALCAGTLLLGGCKEKGPLINLSNTQAQDSSYILAAIPAADQHAVLVEEFSGPSCTNCPAGHDKLITAANSHPGQVNIICMYPTGINLTKPVPGAKYDFRDGDANNLTSALGSAINSLPNAFIDRALVNSNLQQINKDTWQGIIDQRVSIATPLNLVVTSSFDATTATASIQVMVTYTQAVSSSQNISVVITEDSMVDFQEYPPYPVGPYEDGVDSNYIFTYVYRDMVSTPSLGDAILPALTSKQAGQVYIRKYTYKRDVTKSVINPEHCHVIAFVNSTDNGDYHVLQSAQTKLVP